MTHTAWVTALLTYLAIAVTFGFVVMLRKQKWNLFSFLKKESLESLERKLYGFDESINPTIITDEDGIVMNVNVALQKSLGFTEGELVGSTMEKMIPPKFYEQHRKGLERAKGKDLEDKKYLLQVLTKDRKEKPIELQLRKRRINKKCYYLAIITDLSEQYKHISELEQIIVELKQMDEIYSKGEEIGKAGSWFWDIEKGFLIPTKGYKEICGLEDLASHYSVNYLRTRVWPKDEEIVKKALERMFQGQDYDITFRQIRTSDLRVITCRSVVHPVLNENNVVKFVWGHLTLLETKNLLEASTSKE
jgi:PAS domain S-box-containing protein